MSIMRNTNNNNNITKRYQSSSPPNHQLRNHYEDYLWIPTLMGRLLAASAAIHVVSEYGFELTLCEGPSMLPTIHPHGEIILVDRFSHRLRGMEGGTLGEDRVKAARARQDAFEEDNKGDENYVWHQSMIPVNELQSKSVWSRFRKQLATGIAVGDVVVVQHPDRRGTICKRVLGLPGDMVVKPPATMRRRRLPRRGGFVNEKTNSLLVIPDGHIWIEGDNSMNSADSRNYGPLPAAMIVGRVLCRVWPLRGKAIMERGARPTTTGPFSGSTILPAGYEGEEIIKAVAKKKDKKSLGKSTKAN